MSHKHLIDEIVKNLSGALPDSLKKIKGDIEKNFQVILKNSFNKLNIVTREEFDAQTKVLARSRKKIEELETRLKNLEKKKST